MKKRIILFFLLSSMLISALFYPINFLYTSSEITNSKYEFVVILDAGHGGEDGGAVAADGTVEKEINLSITLKLNEVLSLFGYETYLIRSTDTSIHNADATTVRQKKVSDIHNRTNTMNLFENCIYVSIHQNKYNANTVWGTQTFYSPNNTQSSILAEFIQRSIVSYIQPENHRKIKKSGTDIYVLYNATKPAVMVECGFLSNPTELEKLKNGDYQYLISYVIGLGIINYKISEA